jgi:hypothetical protein
MVSNSARSMPIGYVTRTCGAVIYHLAKLCFTYRHYVGSPRAKRPMATCWA